MFLGVLVLSWYPPGLADDNGEPAEDMVPAVLDAAYRHNLKVKGISMCGRDLKSSEERAQESRESCLRPDVQEYIFIC